MKLVNALKKLEREGFLVRPSGWKYQAEEARSEWVIEFHESNGDIQSISVRLKNDYPDPQTDYFPYFWKDNLTQAIKSVKSKRL